MNVYTESKAQGAQKTYETLCLTLDNLKWRYNRDDQNRVVTTSAIGKDLTMDLRMVVSEERQVMYLKSCMPYHISPAYTDVVGKALHIANFTMLNGCFEFDQKDGYVGFKIVIPFFNSVISEEVCRYMINLSCQMVDRFNDKILLLAKGGMTLDEFRAFAEGK